MIKGGAVSYNTLTLRLMIKIFTYEDEKRRRDSLRALLELSTNFEVVGEAFNCQNVLEEMTQIQPDVVLMDINMPEVNGLEGLKIIHEHFPSIKVLIQTAYDDDEKIFTALKNGASGYILKSDSPERIIQAINEVHNGGAAMNPAIAMRIIQYFQPKVQKCPLTPKEIEVLELLSEGLSYKMIAARLNISTHTINSHAKNIYEKLHISSQGEAISYYYNHLSKK